MDTKKIFHSISYLQYPLLAVVLYYYVLFFISTGETELKWTELNNALVFLGIQIGVATLQDTTKTQNEFSRKIWENSVKGKIAIWIMTFVMLLFLIIGLIGFLGSRENVHKEISFGLITLGIGLIGMLKSAIEMFENHRKDKKNSNS